MRISRLTQIWLLAAGCLVSGGETVRPAAPLPEAKPSVLLITIDTLRADHISPYGYALARTPNMSALAREGALFENTYVQTPITLPSHASILTGAYPMYHKLQDVVGRLREGVPTLATILKANGYATAAFVGSTVLSSRWKLNRGFDTYDDHFDLQEGLREIDFDRIERKADDVLSPALKWLGSGGRQPFFLWLHFYDPHDPYTPPPPFAAEFKAHPYDGEIAYVDATLGKLFERLRTQGLDKRTLVVLTADHGESLGEHKEAHHAYFIYDASLKVPLIIRFPDGRFAGRRISNRVRSIDIAPTILRFLNLEPPASMQGESLLSMAAGKGGGSGLPVYAETYYPKIHFNWSPLFSFQSGDLKYIDAPHRELYNTKTDPRELDNIVSSNLTTANRLRRELRNIQSRYSAGGAAPAANPQVDPEAVARLKSLGYVALPASSGSNASTRGLPDPKDKITVYNQMNRGIALSRRGLSDKAIEIFSQVIQSEPSMPIGHFLLASEYFDKGWFIKAAEEYRETIKYNPDSNVAMFSLARSYLEAGETERAEQGFKYLLQREPDHFAARHFLSICYSRQSRYQEAVAEELKALKQRPDYVEAYNNLGSYYLNLQDTDRAIEAYRKALSLRPDWMLVHLNLSLAFIKNHAYDEAIEQAQWILARDPKRPLAQYYLGQAYLAKGMRQEARDAFQRAKELNPKLDVPSIP